MIKGLMRLPLDIISSCYLRFTTGPCYLIRAARAQKTPVGLIPLSSSLHSAACFIAYITVFRRQDKYLRISLISMQVLGIKFAPLNVPLERRLQTLAAGFWFVTVAFLPFIGLFSMVYLILYTRYWMLAMLYLTWIYYDRHTSCRGGRRIEWIRNWKWWHYFRYYFPIALHKTADLPPDRNYLFCTFPHGILCSGAFGTFATNHSDFSQQYPGLVPYLITITFHFIMPLSRELTLGLGSCSASRESLMHLLKEDKESKAVVLMVGGASEALNCNPGPDKIILKKRKGFIKIALETGTALVPVFSFGETDLFEQLSGSLLNSIQTVFQKFTGMAPCLPIGRGLFQYTFGLVPRRHPVNIVVGEAIPVEKVKNPTHEQIDKLHAEFTKSLIKLFEENKQKFVSNPEKRTLIIE